MQGKPISGSVICVTAESHRCSFTDTFGVGKEAITVGFVLVFRETEGGFVGTWEDLGPNGQPFGSSGIRGTRAGDRLEFLGTEDLTLAGVKGPVWVTLDFSDAAAPGFTFGVESGRTGKRTTIYSGAFQEKP